VHRVALARQEAALESAASASDSDDTSSMSSDSDSPRSVSSSLGAPGRFLKQPHSGFRATWSEAASYPGHVEHPHPHHHHHHRHHHHHHQNPAEEASADTGYC